MKNLMKRSAAALLALIMCVGMLNLTAFAAEPSFGDVIGNCAQCGAPIYYAGIHDGSGYSFQCYNCNNNGYVAAPGTYEPSAPTTGNFCPKCYKPILVVEPMDDTYCWQKHCPGCGYDDKPTHDFGSDGDSEACMNGCGYKNPNWVPLPDGVIQAECGGTYKYDPDTGLAIVLTKGTSCVDENVHDHECDFCHAKMLVTKWVDDGVADCYQGGKRHEECVYAGCTLAGSYGVEYTDPLDPVFPDTWTMDNNMTHSRVCMNCKGGADKHTETEAHKEGTYSEFVRTAEGHPYDPETQTLWVSTAPCIGNCGYEYKKYEVREKLDSSVDIVYKDRATDEVIGYGDQVVVHEGQKIEVKAGTVEGYDLDDDATKYAEFDGKEVVFYFKARTHTLTINYRYVDENGEVMGEEGQVAEPYVGTFKEGEDYSVESPVAPAGYAREAGMDTVAGKMGTGDEVRTVKYEIITYTQTIIYRYADGDEINRVERKFTVKNRTSLETVDTPAIAGYTADKLTVAAPEVLDDVTVTVTYAANSPVPSNPGTEPSNPGTSEPPVEVTEPVTPLEPLPEDPEVEVPDDPTPLNPLPELPEEPIEVEDPETPLGPLPELPEEPVEVEVEDPDVPLANVPQTGDNTALWATTAVVSGTGLIWLAVDGRKRREDAE